MRSDIYGTEIDKGLETIVESMNTHVDTDTVDETGCNTKREGAADPDKFECPKCGELIQAAHCN
tara:strand:+ start:514 stop:705 length:192 start_codon:yes stop_codon:yes gene_type:complete